jgi:hypothetical protein
MSILGRTSGALVVAVVLLAGCGDKSIDTRWADETVSPDASAAETVGAAAADGQAFDGADWDGWTATFADVRHVEDDDVDVLLARVDDLRAATWTAGYAGSGAEIAWTPEHVRVTGGPVAVHLDPTLGDTDDSFLAVCVAGGGCVVPPEAEDAFDDPSLFTMAGESVMAVMTTALLTAEDVEEVLDEGTVFLTTIASPMGDLDCLVHAADDRAPSSLEGKEIDLTETQDGQDVRVSLCVDGRGLVVVSPSRGSFTTYASWRPGVDGDVTEQVEPPDYVPTTPAPGAELVDVFWGAWEPVYADVRATTDEEVDALRDRAAGLASRDWTATDATYGMEISYTPTRARVSIEGMLDAYTDPRNRSEEWEMVICDDEGCSHVGPDTEVDAPHLTGSFSDAMIYTGLGAIRSQTRPPLGLGEHTALATVDSPVGPLDCVVTGARARDVEVDALEGLALTLDPSAVDPDEGPFLLPVCVDSRGLVIIDGTGLMGYNPVRSWHEGVDGPMDYPFEVEEYGAEGNR